jgi:hypothetical protein
MNNKEIRREITTPISSQYWVICTRSYEIDGNEIPKGRMDYYTSTRPIMNKDWRRATVEEVETKQHHKGNWFNLRNV